MITTIFTAFCFFSAGCFGLFMGQYIERQKWNRYKKMAIAGQRLWVPNLGEVFILGYSEDSELIDIIPETFLEGKWPSEVDEEVLDRNTISVPVTHFIAQLDESYKKASKV